MSKIVKFIKRVFVRELQRLRASDYIFYYIVDCLRYPMNEKQILMLSESRETLSGNLKFIDEHIDKSEFKVVYSLKESILNKRTKAQKKELCRLLAQSKYILVDDFIPVLYPIPLRKETRFIQVWHAMGAFKQVGWSRCGKEGGPAPRSLTHKNYTDTIVSSEAIRKDYAEAFGIGIERVHSLGIPRTDIFFEEDYAERIKRELYEKYPQLVGKKVILFAPTFRGVNVKEAHYDYSWISFKKIKEELGQDYIFIVKMHPFIKQMPMEELDPQFFLDLSEEREINDLLFITDVLITDYSSVIFEASLLEIPTIFFVPDLEEYVRDRDFYYDYNEYTFGQVVRTDDELIEGIKNPVLDTDKLKSFKEKFCGSCDGHSAQRFVEHFFGK